MTFVRPTASLVDLGDNIGLIITKQLEGTFRKLLRGPSATIADTFIRLQTGEPHPFGNFAIIADSDDVGLTNEAIEVLCNSDAPAATMYSGGDVGAEVASCLNEKGFVEHGAMPAMAVEIDRLADTLLPRGYEFERTTDGPDGAEWADAFAIGYEIPARVAQFFSPTALRADMAENAAIQFYAIRKNGRIVATSLMFLNDGLAGIYCV